ncbi:MAG: hypothetical protein OYL41_04350 [Acidobacteriota bacterium]|nr:hypothetical protein [Acidobacteriota bacterium]
MPDIAKIRRLYFDPPPADLERLPSREELYAREERQAVERCLLSGGDPREDALGEHGSLIGGPGKPLRRFTWDPEFAPGSHTPLPLPWFDHPRTTSRPDPPPSAEEVRIFFGHLAAGHLAGYPGRPSGAELSRIFRAARMTPVQRDQVWHVFACIHLWDLPGLLYPGGLSVYEVARAIHLSETLRPHVTAWINLFGAPPNDDT